VKLEIIFAEQLICSVEFFNVSWQHNFQQNDSSNVCCVWGHVASFWEI